MTVTAMKEKIRAYIDTADVKSVKDIYSKVEEGIEEKKLSTESKRLLMKQAASDPMFLADQKEVMDDFRHIDIENI